MERNKTPYVRFSHDGWCLSGDVFKKECRVDLKQQIS